MKEPKSQKCEELKPPTLPEEKTICLSSSDGDVFVSEKDLATINENIAKATAKFMSEADEL